MPDAPSKFQVRPAPVPEPAGQSTAHDGSIVIFGASGDLAARKLIPALFTLAREGFLAEQAPIVGVARRDKSDDDFRAEMREAVLNHGRCRPKDDDEWQQFARRLHYRRLDLARPDDYSGLARQLGEIEAAHGTAAAVRVVYLATDPELFLPAVHGLAAGGLIPHRDDPKQLRVVLEKPFGHDLVSAQQLTRDLSQLLREEQIFRIDHYLGKETVQNILLFRFGNSIFEPLLNRHHVDHVQITVAESQGIERGRGAYYDRTGALRDVLQNHLLQLLCLVAMEPPSSFSAHEIRNEKLKVLQALAPGRSGAVDEWAVAGQYVAAALAGRLVPGYREEERVPPDTRRETFAAMEVRLDNWRWAGVPFYLRTGKRLAARVTEIAVQFQLPPLHLFSTVECEGDICDLVGTQPNRLLFRIQPRESISVGFGVKRPGLQYQIQPVRMDFEYEELFARGLPEAYERLLTDVLRGDSTLFTRSDELEAAWRFVTPVLEHWEQPAHQPEPYLAGTWGPRSANHLLERTGRAWRTPT